MLLKKFVLSFIILIFLSPGTSASLLEISMLNLCTTNADFRGTNRGECENDREFSNDSFDGRRKYARPGGPIYDSDWFDGRQIDRGNYAWQDDDQQRIAESPNKVRHEKETQTKQIGVTTNDSSGLNGIKLTLKVRANSRLLTNQDKNKLLDFVNKIASQSGIEIIIEGYTASDNNTEENMELSRKRANLVKELLVEQGIDADQITAVGRGIENPLAGNDTRDGRRMNRRVEISIIYN